MHIGRVLSVFVVDHILAARRCLSGTSVTTISNLAAVLLSKALNRLTLQATSWFNATGGVSGKSFIRQGSVKKNPIIMILDLRVYVRCISLLLFSLLFSDFMP